TLFFLLVGRPPFPASTATAKLLRHQNDEPPLVASLRPDVPPTVCELVRKLLAKRPEERCQTPAELADALAASLQPAPAPVSPFSGIDRGTDNTILVPPSMSPHQRYWFLALAGAILGAIVLVLLLSRKKG